MSATCPPSEEPDDSQLRLFLEALLNRHREGDPEALGELVSLLYDQLHRIAQGKMKQQGVEHTLQPTALVSELYLRLEGSQAQWKDHRHFLTAAAIAMRHILVDHARKKASGKALPPDRRIDMDAMLSAYELGGLDMIALDEALDRLAEKYPRCAELVSLRFFAGLEVSECARLLEVSERQCQRWMVFIKGFLHRELSS